MFYSDPFYGFLDALVQDGVAEEYVRHVQRLESLSTESKFSYIFESQAALCRFLSVKYPLGKRTRIAYRKGDKAELAEIVRDYRKAEDLLEDFCGAFQRLWYKENKPNGFEVQDLRLGGLARRLRSCRERLICYLNGKMECIAELEEDILSFHAFGQEATGSGAISLNSWAMAASVNLI